MAVPTPTTWTQWDGSSGTTYWNAVWSTADNFTDTVVVDISSLTGVGSATAPASVKVTGLFLQLNGDITATLEFDATTDQLIHRCKNKTDSTLIAYIGYEGITSGGRVPANTAAGFVGDIILTTENVASGDELTVIVSYRGKT